MIIKNKTNASQSVVLEDGSKLTARPHRTIVVDTEPKGFNKDVWEIESSNIETKKGK